MADGRKSMLKIALCFYPGFLVEGPSTALSHCVKPTHLAARPANFRQIPLTNFEVLVKAVDFYFTDSNIIIPHSALKGATPEEIFTGIWTLEKIKQINERITAVQCVLLLHPKIWVN